MISTQQNGIVQDTWQKDIPKKDTWHKEPYMYFSFNKSTIMEDDKEPYATFKMV